MAHAEIPVWTYWEGQLPDWIADCRDTIAHHVPQARFLDPESFGELRGDDLDVDLSGLYVAHRADVIRAYLLARYGGLWIDQDCVVMRPLDEVFDLVEEHDYVGHLERQGRISNAFIASRPNGRIATAHLDRILRILRSGAPIEWLTLGAAAVTDVIRETGAPWHRLRCELVQPVCWSEPGNFFVLDDDAGHAARFDPTAYCYMLSNNSVQAWVTGHPGEDIRAPSSFFRYLVDRSLGGMPGADQPARGGGSISLAGHVPLALELIARLRPTRILDAPAATGRWAALILDLAAGLNASSGELADGWSPRVDAATVRPETMEPRLASLYGAVNAGDIESILGKRPGAWDLIVLEPTRSDGPGGDRLAMIDAAMDAAPYVFVALAGDEADGDPHLALVERHPIQAIAWRETSGTPAAAALLSRRDPRRLRRRSRSAATFERIVGNREWLSAESSSGPGSSLEQTATLRRELPDLLKRLRTQTLLDVPCGDMNWMRHVIGRVPKYIGADIVPSLVAQNRIRFGSDRATFAILDVLSDLVPRADVVLMRDLLVHLSFDDAFRAIRNVCGSGARYLLTTTFTGRHENHDIVTGDWRPLNLEDPPFAFPAPRELLYEGCTEGFGQYADKALGLWRVRDLLPADSAG